MTFLDGNAAFGGGIYNHGTLTVSDSAFANNAAGYGGNSSNGSNGGAIANDGFLTVNNSAFVRNSNTAIASGGNAVVVINDSVFASNLGGAISDDNSLTVNNSFFVDNTSSYANKLNGGAIDEEEVGHLTINRDIFIGNHADGNGGAIFAEPQTTISISNSIFFGNTPNDIAR